MILVESRKGQNKCGVQINGSYLDLILELASVYTGIRECAVQSGAEANDEAFDKMFLEIINDEAVKDETTKDIKKELTQ